MALQNLLGDLNLQATQADVLAALNAILAEAVGNPNPSTFPLPQAQVDALVSVQAQITNFPANVPLPQAQIDALKVVVASISNFPTTYALPASQVTTIKPLAHPTEFPLPQTQVDAIVSSASAEAPPAETRLDYAGRPDGNPVYVGAALQGTLTTSDWRVQKLEYDTSGRMVRLQTIIGPWDSRATLAWS